MRQQTGTPTITNRELMLVKIQAKKQARVQVRAQGSVQARVQARAQGSAQA